MEQHQEKEVKEHLIQADLVEVVHGTVPKLEMHKQMVEQEEMEMEKQNGLGELAEELETQEELHNQMQQQEKMVQVDY